MRRCGQEHESQVMDNISVARVLHVLAIIHWIGGLAFVTLIVLPMSRSRGTVEQAWSLFENIERRFSQQVRISIPLAGATGLWMTYRMDIWDRFADLEYWWMTAMFGLWLAFMLMVFVVEPHFHPKFAKNAQRDPEKVLLRVSRLHQCLLLLAALTAFGAVAGSHGVRFF